VVVLNNFRRWLLGLYAQVERLSAQAELYPLKDLTGMERDIIIWREQVDLFNYAPARLENWFIHIGTSPEPPMIEEYALVEEIAQLPVSERELRLNPDGTLSLILRGTWKADRDVVIREWGLSLQLRASDGTLYRFLFLREITLPYTVRKGEEIRIGWIITY